MLFGPPSLRRRVVLTLLLGSACQAELPAGLERLRVETPPGFAMRDWVDKGYTHLTPPIRLPSSDPSTAQVEVWAKLPPDSITVVQTASGPTLRFGPGAAFDRIEWAGLGKHRRIVDVRGTTIEADGTQRFHTLRPNGDDLTGIAWSAADPHLHELATAAMVAMMAETPQLRSMPSEAARRELGGFQAKNGCAGCHQPAVPSASHAGGRLVRRGTDGSGFYVPSSVLVESSVLETYGRFDPNPKAPFVTVSCANGQPASAQGPRPTSQCADGSAPTAHLDLAAALASSDPHAHDVCRSRDVLRAAMDDTARTTFASSFNICRTANTAMLTPSKKPWRTAAKKVQ